MPSASPQADTLQRIETIIRRDLKLGGDVPVTPDMPFFGGEADIDSLDILLLLSSIEKEFGLRIPSEAVGREVFANVGTLVSYIERHRAGGASTAPAASPAAPSPDPLARLPHRDPFRFITRVTRVTEGESAEAVWAPTGNEAFFAGHFPGNPLVPGVLMAEALAQVAGLAAGLSAGGEGRLAHVDVRFEQPVVPPAEIRLMARVTRTLGGLRQFDVTASVGPDVVARGTIALSFGPAARSLGGGAGNP
jgi:3-hydroxyacyl-[acyl-carrier-protein] dehydratase